MNVWQPPCYFYSKSFLTSIGGNRLIACSKGGAASGQLQHASLDTDYDTLEKIHK